MSIKISFLHYMKGTRVMLPVVFEEFEVAYIFLAVFFFFFSMRAGDTGGGGSPWPPSLTFLRNKKRKGEQRGKRKTFKTETIKRLSPRSKCYFFSHSRVSRVQFFWSANHGGRQYLSAFHGPSTLKSISPSPSMIVKW